MTIKAQLLALSEPDLESIRRDLKLVGFTDADRMTDTDLLKTLLSVGKAALMSQARNRPT